MTGVVTHQKKGPVSMERRKCYGRSTRIFDDHIDDIIHRSIWK